MAPQVLRSSRKDMDGDRVFFHNLVTNYFARVDKAIQNHGTCINNRNTHLAKTSDKILTCGGSTHFDLSVQKQYLFGTMNRVLIHVANVDAQNRTIGQLSLSYKNGVCQFGTKQRKGGDRDMRYVPIAAGLLFWATGMKHVIDDVYESV
jgi:hypothetical protein